MGLKGKAWGTAAAVAAGVCALVPTAAGAAEKPLWEVGAGISAFSFPAYRGSDRQRNFALPVPYVVYRGTVVQADRHGVRGRLFRSDRATLTLSLAASPPIRSGDVPAREGMPSLRPTAEFGPELDLALWRSPAGDRSLRLRLPARAAFTLESSPKDVGWVFSPNLNADFADLPGLPDWHVGLVAGPIYATRRQHEYFYGVAPQYATATRPAYAARGGYSGSQFLVSLSKRFDRTWFGAFVRYDTLGGAAFADSPLVQRRNSVAAGFAVSWVISESKTLVPVGE